MIRLNQEQPWLKPPSFDIVVLAISGKERPSGRFTPHVSTMTINQPSSQRFRMSPSRFVDKKPDKKHPKQPVRQVLLICH